jgi:spore protease
MRDIYTDLALEMAENHGDGLDGLEMNTEVKGSVKITTICITNDKGAAALGKPCGKYITIESPDIKTNNISVHEEIMGILADKLSVLKGGLSGRLGGLNDGSISPTSAVLVVGLGNHNVTPDALGPKVVSKVLVTRHIMETLPKELDGVLRPLCAMAPGVMGMTGIETAEVVRGLVDNIKPGLVVAIDALAARNICRINQTIQLTDTGISPGAGVGNRRMAINQENLGVPVLAVGVPTVVDAATFVNDTLDMFLSQMSQEAASGFSDELKDGADFFRMLNMLEDVDKYAIIRNTIDPLVGNMFVTPKEIGEVVGWLSNIIANGINMAMHKGIDKDDINRFMY